MLTLVIPSNEKWDEQKCEFIYNKGGTLQLEHSLLSVSKWEAIWNKPFLANDEKTSEQLLDYIRCMTITQDVDSGLYNCLTENAIHQIVSYINRTMTATTFSTIENQRSSREIVTSELIYYWMITLNIPFECQKWHINRLLTLIRICNIKNQPKKRIGRKELLSRNAQLNAARRQNLNSRG